MTTEVSRGTEDAHSALGERDDVTTGPRYASQTKQVFHKNPTLVPVQRPRERDHLPSRIAGRDRE